MRKRLLTVFIAVTVSLPIIAGGWLAASAQQAPGRDLYNVGLKVMDFEFNRPQGREMVTTAIWYPTDKPEKPFTYQRTKTREYSSTVAVNAPVAREGGPFPLVLFSTGGYGFGYSSAFFCEYLAGHGYIVVAPDYLDFKPPAYKEQVAFGRIKKGNTAQPLEILKMLRHFRQDMSDDREFFLSYMAEHRFDHASFVIDKMLELNNKRSFLQGMINENEIGACGHSLGGLTTLGKIGAHPDKKFKDDRIKAAVLFSSSVYPFEYTLPNIDVPIMVMVGENDPANLHPNVHRRLVYENAKTPKYLLILKGGDHLSFSNSVCEKTPLYQAVKSNPLASAICRYGLAFFDKYLKEEPASNIQLHQTDPALLYYAIEEKPGEEQEWGILPPPDTDRSQFRESLKEKFKKAIEERHASGGRRFRRR